MKISLIICTRNRSRQLRECLDYVGRLNCEKDWELIIVDNGSSDDTPRVVREFAEKAHFDVRVVNEPRPGLGRAHNAGIAHARGEILAFTDDDCYVDSNFLNEVISVFEDPEIGYAGGRILLFDPTDAPVTIRPEHKAEVIPPGSVVRAGRVKGANMAARRTVIEAVGGFDPMLGPGTPFNCEDVDFVARASGAGWKGGYFPGPLVYHHHSRKPGKEVSAVIRSYDYGRGAYYAKFILNPQTRMLYAKHWWWQLRLRTTWRFLREIRGAGLYCLARLFQRLRLGKSTEDGATMAHCHLPTSPQK